MVDRAIYACMSAFAAGGCMILACDDKSLAWCLLAIANVLVCIAHLRRMMREAAE